MKERPGQVRGVPWTASVMEALHNFQGYEDAEVVAARVASGKMGFFTHPEGEGEAPAEAAAPEQAEAATEEQAGAKDDKKPGFFRGLFGGGGGKGKG